MDFKVEELGVDAIVPPDIHLVAIDALLVSAVLINLSQRQVMDWCSWSP
jgi:hypothetical protein